MNKLRKIIALMLSLSVIFTAAISVFSAENFDDDGNRDNNAGLSDEEQNVLIQDSHPKHELDNPDDAYIEDIEYDTYIMGKNEYDETVKSLQLLKCGFLLMMVHIFSQSRQVNFFCQCAAT